MFLLPGLCPKGDGSYPEIHTPRFDFNDKAIPLGIGDDPPRDRTVLTVRVPRFVRLRQASAFLNNTGCPLGQPVAPSIR